MEDKAGNKNQLYPVFLKLNEMQVLLVGAGNVAIEKLHSLLSNSPSAAITIVAPLVKDEINELLKDYPVCKIVQRTFEETDLEGKDIVFLATDNKELHRQIKEKVKEKKLLVNVADTPELCDFYLGSIVQKGHLKLAVSTNGMSPTIGKRLKELLAEALPGELDEVIEQLNQIRNTLKGDFTDKVHQLNELTKQLTTRK